MSKNVLLGIAAFGGLVLIGVLLNDTPSDTTVSVESVESVAVSIPDGLSGFPIYPTEHINSVRDTAGEEARDISLSLNADASMSEIHEWYRAELSQNGWNIKSDKNVGGYQIIQGEKDNLYTSLQTANGESGTVVISQHLKVRN